MSPVTAGIFNHPGALARHHEEMRKELIRKGVSEGALPFVMGLCGQWEQEAYTAGCGCRSTTGNGEVLRQCERLAVLRRETRQATKTLVKLVWADKELRTGPARRAEIRMLLESDLETEAMVEVLETLVRRHVTEWTRGLLGPAAFQKGVDSFPAEFEKVHVQGEVSAAGAGGALNVQGGGADVGKVSGENVSPAEVSGGVAVRKDDPPAVAGDGAEKVGAVNDLDGDGGHDAEVSKLVDYLFGAPDGLVDKSSPEQIAFLRQAAAVCYSYFKKKGSVA